jgi:hypothetical protein
VGPDVCVYSRLARIRTLARRSHQMVRRRDKAAVQNVCRTCCLQGLARHIPTVFQHFEAVLAIPVRDTRRPNTARILQIGVDLGAILFFRQVFAITVTRIK